MVHPELTAEILRKTLQYDAESGRFTWLRPSAPGSNVRCGDEAGSPSNKGYIQIFVMGKSYKAHRLAWLYMTGEWPCDQIDHRNTIKNDNSWQNLRVVTNSVNRQNSRKANCDSRTGILGVTQRGARFRAQIKLNGRVRMLGSFATPEAAHQAYLHAKRVLHEGCMI